MAEGTVPLISTKGLGEGTDSAGGTITWAYGLGTSTVAGKDVGEADWRLLTLMCAFPFLFIKTEIVTDPQLSTNREVSQCGDYIY